MIAEALNIFKPYPPFNWNNDKRGEYCAGVEGRSLVQLGTYMNNTDGYGFRQEADDEHRSYLDRECGIDGFGTYPELGELTSQIKGLKHPYWMIIETELEFKGPGKTGWLFTTQAKRMQFEWINDIYDIDTDEFRDWAIPLQNKEIVRDKEAAMGTLKTYKRRTFTPEERADCMFYVSYARFLKDVKHKCIIMPKLLDNKTLLPRSS